MENHFDCPVGESLLEEQAELEFWSNLNRKCCDQESVVSSGAWLEADKTGF